MKIEDLLYRSPRRRHYNPYEPEASLCLFYYDRQHSFYLQAKIVNL